MPAPIDRSGLLLEPADLSSDSDWQHWFDAIAFWLLNGTRLLVAGIPHRLIEIEFYYHSEQHPDPFPHCDPLQRTASYWYLHRSNGRLRNGSFKGLDLTFGGPTAFGGILIRGIEQEDGPLIDGPSLTVDHLLRLTGTDTVAQLDATLCNRLCWDSDSPLHLQSLSQASSRRLLRTARVGLPLRDQRVNDRTACYLLRPYRYLNEPRRIRKGKAHMLLALLLQGVHPADIREQIATTQTTIDRCRVAYQRGKTELTGAVALSLSWGTETLARLHGLHQAQHGLCGLGWIDPLAASRE